MDEPRGDLDVLRARREEAVRDSAERLAKPVAVGEPGDADRQRARAGLGAFHERLDGVPERRLHRRARPAVRLDRLELVVTVAEHLADDRLRLRRRLAGQQTRVDRDVADRGHDVSLLRRGDHRRRESERDEGLDKVAEER